MGAIGFDFTREDLPTIFRSPINPEVILFETPLGKKIVYFYQEIAKYLNLFPYGLYPKQENQF